MKKLNVVAISTLFVFLVIAAMPGLGLADVYYTCINKMSGARRQVCGNNCGSMEVARATTTTCASTTSPPAPTASNIIYGSVNGDGTIRNGTGFTVQHVSGGGGYSIIFNSQLPMVPVCTVNATVPAMWIDAWLGSYYGTGYPSQCGTYYQTETPLTELDVTCLNPIFDVPNPSGPPAYAYYDYGEASFNFICVY